MCTDTVISCLSQLFSVFGMPAYIHSDRGASFMSNQLKTFLHNKGIVTSRTTPYNPHCNGQAERYNGIIWKSVNLALKTRNLPTKCWETVLPDALHSIRSLISTATNETPHERLFSYQRRSSTGCSIPSWLSVPGPVLLKKHVRNSKYDPLTEEVELIEANHKYAHVKYPSGRETTVSLRHLAPGGSVPSDMAMNNSPIEYVADENSPVGSGENQTNEDTSTDSDKDVNVFQPDNPVTAIHNEHISNVEPPPLRRSDRIRNAPNKLDL